MAQVIAREDTKTAILDWVNRLRDDEDATDSIESLLDLLYPEPAFVSEIPWEK